LGKLAIPFSVVVAHVEEHEDPDTDPRRMVSHNAALKADWVAERHPNAWVLGADTTVFVDNQALNKPADLNEARAMLRRLSGREHTVFTGLALRHRSRGLRQDKGVASTVVFKPLDDALIETYLSRVHTLDKAGGYAIQEHGDLIIAEFRGSHSNVVGLPLDETKQIFTEAGLLP
jgi:septum formation protein